MTVGPEPVRVLQVLPGRSIALSPEWRDDGLSVLFDRNSGDYWVVSTLARRLVELLADGERRSEAELGRAAAAEPQPLADDGQAEFTVVLAELMQLGLLTCVDDLHVRAGAGTGRA